MIAWLSHAVVEGLRYWGRFRNKVHALIAAPSFSYFGKRSSLALPVTLWRQDLISLGDDVFIGANSWLQVTENPDRDDQGGPRLRIGNGVSITGQCFIVADQEVVIGDRVLMGRFVHISDHAHEFSDTTIAIRDQGISTGRRVEIGEGTWLGQGVVICPGVTVGRNCVVGANSVVNQDLPDCCVAVGAPARIVKKLEKK